MEMNVPDNFRAYMSKMTFTVYDDKYNPKTIYSRAEYLKKFGGYVPRKTLEVAVGAVAPKKCRNMYDARMRDTNLYVRYLEHKIKYFELLNKKKKKISSDPN